MKNEHLFITTLILFIMVIFLSGCSKSEVLAEINGKEITINRFISIMREKSENPSLMAEKLKTDWRYLKLNLNDHIENTLLDYEITENDFDKSKFFDLSRVELELQYIILPMIHRNEIQNKMIITDEDLIDFQKELKVKHIFFKFNNREKTLELADHLVNQVKKGYSFEELAFKYSDAENLIIDRGRLGWLMLQDAKVKQYGEIFAKELNQMEKGEIRIIDNRNGNVFVVNLLDKVSRWDIPLFNCNIIKLNYHNINTTKQQAYEKAISVYEQMTKNYNAVPFERLAEQYSEDESSRRFSGFINNGDWINHLEAKKYFKGLENDILKYSKEKPTNIVESLNGLHIFKLMDNREVSIEQLRENQELMNKILIHKEFFTFNNLCNSNKKLYEKEIKTYDNFAEANSDEPVLELKDGFKLSLNEFKKLYLYSPDWKKIDYIKEIEDKLCYYLFWYDAKMKGFLDNEEYVEIYNHYQPSFLRKSYMEYMKGKFRGNLTNYTDKDLKEFYEDEVQHRRYIKPINRLLPFEEAKALISKKLDTEDEQTLLNYYEDNEQEFYVYSEEEKPFEEVKDEVEKDYIQYYENQKYKEYISSLYEKYNVSINEEYFQELSNKEGLAPNN